MTTAEESADSRPPPRPPGPPVSRSGPDELIARALPLATGRVRAELLYLQGVIEARTGDLRGAVAILVEAADTSEDGSLTLER